MENTFNKEDYRVLPVEYDDVKEWCLHKHYAHRMPCVSYAYGLYEGLTLVGVCIYGIPANHTLVEEAFHGEYMTSFMELNRLCVNDGLPRNALSWFVAQTLKLLPKPLVLVSYADKGHNHHGYIYQATNWLYTGETKETTYFTSKRDSSKHQRHAMENLSDEDLQILKDKGELVKMTRSSKFRYFFLLGDKRQQRRMRKLLKYPVLPHYPKGDNIRYDASHVCSIQGLLF